MPSTCNSCVDQTDTLQPEVMPPSRQPDTPSTGMGGSDVTRLPRRNIPPSRWGRHVWLTLYALALGYPNSANTLEMEAMAQLIKSLPTLLPCESCRTHLARDFKEHPPDPHLGGSEQLITYIAHLEARVAARLQKVAPSLPDTLARLRDDTQDSQCEDRAGSTKAAPPPSPDVRALPALLSRPPLPSSIGVLLLVTLCLLVIVVVVGAVLRKRRGNAT